MRSSRRAWGDTTRRGVAWIASIEKSLLRHRFCFTAGNQRQTTVDQYVAGLPWGAQYTSDKLNGIKDVYLGFNIYAAMEGEVTGPQASVIPSAARDPGRRPARPVRLASPASTFLDSVRPTGWSRCRGCELVDARHGGRPRLQTSVRVGLRGRTLCVRFDGRDAGVVATHTERDAPLWQEDVFEVFLSPRERPTVYFEFEVNPLGALFDARIDSPELCRESMRAAAGWDCPGFEARVVRRSDRWSATLAVPLDPLLEGPPPAVWRANFYRIDRGGVDEFSAWSPTLAEPPDFHRPERFGLLRIPL